MMEEDIDVAEFQQEEAIPEREIAYEQWFWGCPIKLLHKFTRCSRLSGKDKGKITMLAFAILHAAKLNKKNHQEFNFTSKYTDLWDINRKYMVPDLIAFRDEGLIELDLGKNRAPRIKLLVKLQKNGDR